MLGKLAKFCNFGITLVVIFLLQSGQPAYAEEEGHTHFRYGHYTWVPSGGNTIEFTLQNAWRRNAYSSSNGRCIDTVTLFSVPCSEPDGFPGIGDVVVEIQGYTLFDPGDGSGTVGSPLGPLMYLVTSIDPVNNWIFGLALDPTSLPAIDTTISHTYPSTGNFLAFTDSCCRISASFAGNDHINNPDISYRVETIVNVGTGNRSPVSSYFPIVLCPIGALCSFVVPGADPDGDTLSFRFSTSIEASGYSNFIQPGPPDAPNAASIDAVTGLYTWDTTGATLANDPNTDNTLYSTQVTIDDGNSKAALDFLIQLVPGDPDPPVITGSTPVCNTTKVVSVGNTLSFGVDASDPDAGDVVTLNIVGLPVGATMTPTLPISGNPISSTFSWTPTEEQLGVYVATFNATSSAGGSTLCSVTLNAINLATVNIDIKPFSNPNSINPKSHGNVSIAILSTQDFDALAEIDILSLTFGYTGDENSSVSCDNNEGEDVNGDGFIDLVCHFDTQLTGFQIGDIAGILKGLTMDGVPIVGSDAVNIVK